MAAKKRTPSPAVVRGDTLTLKPVIMHSKPVVAVSKPVISVHKAKPRKRAKAKRGRK